MTFSGPEFGEKSLQIFSQIINLQTAPSSVLKDAEKEIDTCRLKVFGILSMIRLAFFVKSKLELKDKS